MKRCVKKWKGAWKPVYIRHGQKPSYEYIPNNHTMKIKDNIQKSIYIQNCFSYKPVKRVINYSKAHIYICKHISNIFLTEMILVQNSKTTRSSIKQVDRLFDFSVGKLVYLFLLICIFSKSEVLLNATLNGSKGLLIDSTYKGSSSWISLELSVIYF